LTGVENVPEDVKRHLSLVDASFAFLLFGGFVYFNRENFPIRSNSFMAGGKVGHKLKQQVEIELIISDQSMICLVANIPVFVNGSFLLPQTPFFYFVGSPMNESIRG
jgi:hypothetical protein